MCGVYHDGSRSLPDRFDTRRLADRIEERIVHDAIDEGEKLLKQLKAEQEAKNK